MVGTWVFVLSDVVGFAALLTTMAALRTSSMAYATVANTDINSGLLATLLLAGVSCALFAARKWSHHSRTLAVLALALALSFCGLQVVEYHELLGPSLQLTTAGQESFIVVTGYHALHVIAGALLLFRFAIKPGDLAPLSLYWHFVDALWVFIFAFYYL